MSNESQETGPVAAVYQAGDLTVDTGRQRVMRGDTELPLPKLSFELLLALIRAAPNLVPLDALMSEVWPKAVVSPETLSQRVKLLRGALGDDAQEPRYVAGLRGRGYRLMVPVSIAAQERPDSHSAGAPAPLPLTRRRWKVLASSAAAFAILAVAAGILWWRGSGFPVGSSSPPSVTVSALPARSVAVLPFENLSGEARDGFVALGIAEGVLHRLAGIEGVTLIARTSSFSLDGKSQDARDIGRRLNTRYLVEGSVQRVGDRLRVTAQLIDAAVGVHVWSLRFDRTVNDIFEVEDEISQSVARALQVSLGETTHPFARFGTEAYLAYLQGRAFVASRKVSDAELAVERFSHAIDLAPDFAAAYVALAGAHIHLANLNGALDLSEEGLAADRAAEKLVTRALQLDDSLGEAYVRRADLKEAKGDFQGAEADFRKGLTLNPNDGRGYELFAAFLEKRDRLDEFLDAIDRARILDPLYPRGHYSKGLVLMGFGAASYDEAESLFLQALSVAPDFHPALHKLGMIRRFTGRFAEAVDYSERAIVIDPRATWLQLDISTLYLDLGDVEAARQVIARIPDAPPEAMVPICLYENDLKGAFRIVRKLGYGKEYSQFDEFYVLRAIRDGALFTGDLAEARQFLQRTAEDSDPTMGKAQMSRGATFFQLDDILVAAQWRKSQGERASSEASARAALAWIDSEMQKRQGHSDDWLERRRALAFAILGQADAAMASLDRAFSKGGFTRWWYDIDREPAFAPFRNQARFQALAARARAHVSEQRRLLEQMRVDGRVPRRTLLASLRAPVSEMHSAAP